jgi:serine/threonine-protein kinase OSR1/STK39
MSLAKHPNVLRVRGTWTAGHKLYIAMRLMSSGSASDVIRYGWPGGMGEEVVKTILKQALEGLKFVPFLSFFRTYFI